VLFPCRGADGTSRPDLPALAAESTLADYQRYAVSNNAGLRAAHARWQAAMQRIPQATALPEPQLSYAFYLQQVETRVGPQRQRVGLTQMFPWFGTLRRRGDAAAKAAEAVWHEFAAARLRLNHQVSVLFHDYYYLRQTLDVTAENFELLRGLEAVARERYRTGQALSAVMQAQVELGKMEDRLRALRALRPALAAKLNAALNREQDAALPWPRDLPDTPAELDAAGILALVRTHNPALARLNALAEKESIAAALARKDGFPDFTLGLTVIDTGSALMPGTPDSGKDPVMATLMLNLPVWRGKYRAARREALLRRQALQRQREEHDNSLVADARMALYHYGDAVRKLDLYRDTLLPMAAQSLAVARQGFEAGKTGFITLIDAQRALLEFQLEAARAKTERGKRFAELQMLTGVEKLPVRAEQSPAAAADHTPARTRATTPGQ